MKDIQNIVELQWPRDSFKLSLLNLSELQTWYASQSPLDMVFIGQTESFKRFMFIKWTVPMTILRFYFKIKNYLCFRKREN